MYSEVDCSLGHASPPSFVFISFCIVHKWSCKLTLPCARLVYSTVCWWHTTDSTNSYKFTTIIVSLLHECEREIYWLDMAINYKKSGCIRIGLRNNVKCASIVSLDGVVFPWVSEIKYLDINIITSRTFKCSFDQAKRSFYRVANSIFGKVERIASEEVTLQPISSKCMPMVWRHALLLNLIFALLISL